ncbi:hypothetical protein EVAR_11712_1 [Eumeta japonica]|uniref:Uncharacterized protein n=1 Tax=Eumeta variegata TaxID=151549 RepID=A0A4C1U649_EUMVA|nr:hypothetical protein EVAR_11712_1 [Eumeta japonica]
MRGSAAPSALRIARDRLSFAYVRDFVELKTILDVEGRVFVSVLLRVTTPKRGIILTCKNDESTTFKSEIATTDSDVCPYVPARDRVVHSQTPSVYSSGLLGKVRFSFCGLTAPAPRRVSIAISLAAPVASYGLPDWLIHTIIIASATLWPIDEYEYIETLAIVVAA